MDGWVDKDLDHSGVTMVTVPHPSTSPVCRRPPPSPGQGACDRPDSFCLHQHHAAMRGQR